MKVATTYLLAVETVVWREGKKLDQGSGPPEPPLILPDGSGPYPYREAAEILTRTTSGSWSIIAATS
jgi:hypothetical protein